MVSARVFVENKNEGRSGKPSGKGRESGKEPRQRSPPEKKKGSTGRTDLGVAGLDGIG